MSESLRSAVAAISAPLDVHASVHGDERYLDLRGELGKLNSPSGGDVDWEKVLSLGVPLLREVGKDLLVCSFSLFALGELYGLTGIALGTEALDELIRSQPEHLKPRKAGARASALKWLLDRLTAALDRTMDPSDGPALVSLKARLEDLQRACSEHLGERSPGFRPLRDLVESQLMTFPAEALTKSLRVDEGAPAEERPEGIDDSGALEPEPLVVAGDVGPWLQAIDGLDLCGLDPRKHHEEYSLVRGELQKGDALVAGVEVDWHRVYELCDLVLREKAKDLQVASWFAISSFHCGGWGGLTHGLGVVAGILQGFPELHPRKVRSRRNSASWLVQRVTSALAHADVADLLPEVLGPLRASCERLNDALRERLGDDAPAARPLRDAFSQVDVDLAAARKVEEVEEVEEVVRVEEPEPDAKPRPMKVALETKSKPDSAPGSTKSEVRDPDIAVASVVDTPANLAELESYLLSTGRALISTASSVRSSTPTEPRAYRLLRAGLWLHLVAPPPAGDDGSTGLPGLDEVKRGRLEGFAAAGQWKGLLQESENLLISYRLILDLNRFTVDALRGLGPEYDAAALEVCAELRALLTRFPRLISLRDRDGVPLANEATQRWISSEVLPRTSGGVPPMSTGETEEEIEFWSGLHARLRTDERNTALSDAHVRISSATSGKQRFLLALRLAEALADAGVFELAEALFQGLAVEADSQRLGPWDPKLVARCLASLVRAQHRNGNTYSSALSKLSLLDPPSASDLLNSLRG